MWSFWLSWRIELFFFRFQLFDLQYPPRQRGAHPQLKLSRLIEKLQAVAFAFGMQDATDVATRMRLNQGDVERYQCVVISIQIPVE